MPAAGGNFCGLKSRIHLEIVISKGFQTLSNDKNAVFHHYNTMLVEKKIRACGAKIPVPERYMCSEVYVI